MTKNKDALISVLVGTGITASSMTLSTNDCDEPCDVTITVIWTNTGKRETFRPAITVNGNNIELGTQITLNKGASTQPIIFNLVNLTENTYEVCPNPN